MHDVLNKNLFLVKEHSGLLKTANDYDILDPETGEIVMECREENIKPSIKILRFFDLLKNTTPFDIQIRVPGHGQIARVTRGVPIVASNVRVLDENNVIIGGFRQKKFSISGAFDVIDANGEVVCTLKGGLTGANYRFLAQNNLELALVTKKWAGLGKELFTSADNFILQIDEAVPCNSIIRQLILSSVICIGIVLKIEIP